MTISWRRKTMAAVAVASSMMLALTACSDDGDSSSSGGSNDASAPIVIGSSGSLSNPIYTETQLKQGLDAAIASINAAGGVKGRELKLEFCDSGYDVNKELSCARELTSKKIVAAVHPSILADQSGAEFKLYAKAGIPVFGSLGLSPMELADENSYPLGSGLPGWCYGAALALKNAGVKKVSVLVDSNPASMFSGKLATEALDSAGTDHTEMVVGDAKADPTFATAAAKAASGGVDGVIVMVSPVSTPIAIKALRQGGYSGKISTITPLLPDVNIEALGSDADGLNVSSQFALVTDTANSGVEKFLADMKKYQPEGAIDDNSLSAWASVQLFAKILETSEATTIDGPAFEEALQNLSDPIDIGAVAPYAVKGRTSPLADFPRILNPAVALGSIKSGELVTDGAGFVDPFEK